MKRDEQLAYVAGLVDGDGSINLCEYSNDETYGSFLTTVSITMRSLRALQKSSGVLGGTILAQSDGMYRLQLQGRFAGSACERLIPFLVAKKAQAELLIRFRKHVADHAHDSRKRCGSEPWRISDSILAERRMMCDEMKRVHNQLSTPDAPLARMKKLNGFAYAAGLIDAEGSITIVGSGRGVLPAMMAEMTEASPIMFLASILGGHLHEEVRRTKRGKVVYSWRIYSNNVLVAAKQMLPYLTNKREQAEIAIRYQNHVNLWNKRLGFGNKNIPDTVRTQRAQWFLDIRSLNITPKRAAAQTKSGHPKSGSYSRFFRNGKAEESSRNDYSVTVA